MKIECRHIVVVNKNGVWLNLVHGQNEREIRTQLYDDWNELLTDSSWWLYAVTDDQPVRVRGYGSRAMGQDLCDGTRR